MKMTAVHLTELAEKITPLDTDERREQYRQGLFPRADRVKDLDQRYRWDLLWDACAFGSDWSDYKDSHIDTALRSIVRPL